MFSNVSSLVLKRTRKDYIFKTICKFLLLIYVAITLVFIGVIAKSGINAFLVTKVKIQGSDQASLYKSILSRSEENRNKINASLSGNPEWVATKGGFNMYYKSNEKFNHAWNKTIEELKLRGDIKIVSSFALITNSDSSVQELAGLRGAMRGTLLTVGIFLTFSTIVGVATGIYLSEFAKNKRLKNFIDLNVSNLASVPPIIYGIFGLNFFVNILFIPRSSSLLGGLILGILTLPIIVIVTSDSLKNVPLHLKFSAKALGLTHIQTIARVCLPYAFPRIITGILISLSRGISEATPLILIGMASFIKSPPSSFTDPATTIATQIYLWLNSPDESFIEKSYGGIFVLVVIVSVINVIASLVRYKVSKRNIVR